MVYMQFSFPEVLEFVKGSLIMLMLFGLPILVIGLICFFFFMIYKVIYCPISNKPTRKEPKYVPVGEIQKLTGLVIHDGPVDRLELNQEYELFDDKKSELKELLLDVQLGNISATEGQIAHWKKTINTCEDQLRLLSRRQSIFS